MKWGSALSWKGWPCFDKGFMKTEEAMKKYDYILVGSGLYSGVFACLAGQKGKKCLVVEKRDHLGGNIFC